MRKREEWGLSIDEICANYGPRAIYGLLGFEIGLVKYWYKVIHIIVKTIFILPISCNTQHFHEMVDSRRKTKNDIRARTVCK